MKSFAPRLLAHFDESKRDLPWRRAPNAYHTLVSELMLQQTVVATVVPYFTRFVARFPDLRALAAASEAEVLTLWSGLGYYSRARNLHRAAQVVVQQHGGTLPADEATLLRLPGVGPYTAAAIAAIAFGLHTFPLDGNGARVFARVFDDDRAIDRPLVREDLRARATALVPRARPGDFAQAVMDLGATVCRVTSPRCGVCPVARNCGAFHAGRAAVLPTRVAKTPKRMVTLSCAVIERGGRVLLVQRPPGTLLGGTFVLPSAEATDEGANETREPGAHAASCAVAAFGLTAASAPQPLGSFRHVFTHLDVTAVVYRVQLQGEDAAPPDGRWIGPGDHAAVALSTFTRKALAVWADAASGPPRAISRPRLQRKTRIVSPETT